MVFTEVFIEVYGFYVGFFLLRLVIITMDIQKGCKLDNESLPMPVPSGQKGSIRLSPTLRNKNDK